MNYRGKSAILSDCGKYRYSLARVWNETCPSALVVMLNPSTADAEKDDATIRSLTRLLEALGFGGFEVVNLFAMRATNPKELANDLTPTGPYNLQYVERAAQKRSHVICAWGANRAARYQENIVLHTLEKHQPNGLYCFGKTKEGAPKHPLYIKTGTQLESYP